MSTFLHPTIVYGPVMSRRLGVSLGLNLSPVDGKTCTFDCLYCECGLNTERRPRLPLPTVVDIARELEEVLVRLAHEGVIPDSITMAGNGEPTVNPDFALIMDKTLSLRDAYAPDARVSVLTNATMMDVPEVRDALMSADDVIAKLDTVNQAYIELLDRPRVAYDVSALVDSLAAFEGRLSIQTMFLHGIHEGHDLTNTTDAHVAPWLEALRTISPASVMVYTIARETPVPTLLKATAEELDAIAGRVRALNIPCSVSY